jgi:hypothetical protein
MPLIGQLALALALRVTVCSIGVDGIFVAGSSVFPTTGHANPTLMIVGTRDTFSGLAQGATILLSAFAEPQSLERHRH